jgi:predicted RNA binding protein YcfA (HicA-like mRNA interferase family)
VDDFPSMKARRLLAILMREPLNYRVVRQSGSHRWLAAPGRPSFPFAFHDRMELKPREVRKVLVKDVGLVEDDALDLL